jgi:DNA-nicking Smr family endonuclease
MSKKNPKASQSYTPFQDLGSLLESQAFPLASGGKKKTEPEMATDSLSERACQEELFKEAMSDVVPLSQGASSPEPVPCPTLKAPQQDSEAQALARLEDLVQRGDGFIVSDTPEYMEGIGYGVNPDMARRLHRGDFSIQGHVDLHGFVVEEAEDAFEQFLRESLYLNKRAVLVIHGRGLSSRKKPVLKTKVKEWLTAGPWRKWVIAFTSARSCDGGAGATYVLLRQQPATKRVRKKARKRSP